MRGRSRRDRGLRGICLQRRSQLGWWTRRYQVDNFSSHVEYLRRCPQSCWWLRGNILPNREGCINASLQVRDTKSRASWRDIAATLHFPLRINRASTSSSSSPKEQQHMLSLQRRLRHLSSLVRNSKGQKVSVCVRFGLFVAIVRVHFFDRSSTMLNLSPIINFVLILTHTAMIKYQLWLRIW